MTYNDVVFLDEMAESQKSISELENRVYSWTSFRSQNQTYATMMVQLLLINHGFENLINTTRSEYDRFSLIEVSPTFSALKIAYLDYLLDYEEFSIYGYKATSEFLNNGFDKGGRYLKAGQAASQNRTVSTQKLKHELNSTLENCEAQMDGDRRIFSLGAIVLYAGFIGLILFNRKRDN
jgi:hypothetical protein